VLDLSLKWISYENLKLEEKDYNELAEYMVEMGLPKILRSTTSLWIIHL